MTAYDPFAYGAVRLANNQQRAPAEPEDVLFADSQPVLQPSSADSSWALLEQDVDGLLPGAASAADDAAAFGAEILGEAPPGMEPEPEAATHRRPVTADRSELAARAPADGMPAMQRRPEVRRRPREQAAAPAMGRGKAPAPAQARAAKRSGRRALGFVAPFVICGAGGAGAAWFHFTQHNPVMAGILGAATLVAALFSWLLLRG